MYARAFNRSSVIVRVKEKSRGTLDCVLILFVGIVKGTWKGEVVQSFYGFAGNSFKPGDADTEIAF